MMGQPTKQRTSRALLCFAGSIGLYAGLLPVLAEAQVSIDQGKSPAEMFSLDCATCHKTARGLAKGRGTSELASFLGEHYTSGKEQAASLAAYVMGAGGGDAAAPAARATPAKPAPERARTDEPKREPGKPEEGTPATARLQPPNEEQKRPGDVPGAQERGRKPAAGRPEPATASRGQQRPEPEVKPPEPPQEVHEAPREAVAPNPAPTAAAPESTPAPTASAPASAESGEGAPVPRDNIPD